MRLRLLAYNVRGFRSGTGRVAAAVSDERPDVAFVNEIGWPRRRLRRFARELGMETTSGAGLLRRGIPNAVLARPPWRIVRAEVVRFARRRRTIRRGMVAAILGREGLRLTAIAVHLGLSGPERLEHAQELTDRLSGWRRPILVGGDLNEAPGARAVSWIADRLWDAFGEAGEGPPETYPASEPTARIDYVFVSEGIDVDRAWVKSEAADASDHLPVFADVTLR